MTDTLSAEQVEYLRGDMKIYLKGPQWARFVDDLCDLAISALDREAVPEGWKLVPEEPDDYMLTRAIAISSKNSPGVIRRQWKAMVLAAPPATPGEGKGEG